MSGRPAVFVDRDGVVNQLVDDPQSGMPESPLDEQDVTLIAGVPDALRSLSAAGFLLVGVSNQPAAAKGKVPVEQLEAVQRRVLTLLDGGRRRIRRLPDLPAPSRRRCRRLERTMRLP